MRLVDLGLHVACRPGGFGRAHVQQLRGVVPFIERLALLHAVVALQAQQLAVQGRRQRLGQLGLADARLAFEQQRTLQLEREEYRSGQAAVGKVAGLPQAVGKGVDGREDHGQA
ncbi:hypothetical protein D9M68_667750 [compost metagenome]